MELVYLSWLVDCWKHNRDALGSEIGKDFNVTQECLLSYWQDVYNVTASAIVEGVVRGLNATIFAYGATGRYAFLKHTG